MRNVLGKCNRENQKVYFIFKTLFLRKFAIYEKVEKYCRAEQATDDNKAHAYCLLDN
jgi:hypothetical protein